MTLPRDAGRGGNKRWWLWLPLLGLGAWLAMFGDKSPTGGTVPPAPRVAQPRPVGTQPPAEPLLALVPRDSLLRGTPPEAMGGLPAGRDLFSVRDWNPMPPSSAPAPAPVAPPLPFAFLGKKLEAQAWEVYLTQGELTLVAREGQVLQGSYRIDKIAPPTMTLTYLPLEHVQTLAIGDSR